MDGSTSTDSGGGGGGIRLDVKQALEEEIHVFEYREKLIFHFKVQAFLSMRKTHILLLERYTCLKSEMECVAEWFRCKTRDRGV